MRGERQGGLQNEESGKELRRAMECVGSRINSPSSHVMASWMAVGGRMGLMD